MSAALLRIAALVRRYLYLYANSWIRIVDLVYWPSVNLLVWGFMQEYLRTSGSAAAHVAGVLVAAVLLWDVLFRSQLGVSLGFIEEMWARNLGHLAVSPLRPHEHVAALLATSLLRTVIGVGGACLLAVTVFGFEVGRLGVGLGLFFANLAVMGWGLGLLVCAVLLRYGLAAETLAWAALFVVQPVCGVFYPVSVLPDWLAAVAQWIPATHVFEGMRTVLAEGRMDWDLLARAAGLNVGFALAGAAAFLGAYHVARRQGLLMRTGE